MLRFISYTADREIVHNIAIYRRKRRWENE